MSGVTPIYLESGSTRVFAGALEWPGWSRSGRDEAEAIDVLLAYGPRYASVLAASRVTDPRRDGGPTAAAAVEVVERLAGGGGTDFGAPGAIPEADQAALDESERARLLAILEACWAALDRQAQAAAGHELRTGPRGGGRDLAKMLGHVLEAEQAYLAKLGSRPPKGDGGPEHLARHRAAVRAAFTARASDEPVPEPNLVRVHWPPRYFVRRAAWHVLDHAWEIEDRVIPA